MGSREWLRHHGRETFESWDFGFACLVAGIVGIFIGRYGVNLTIARTILIAEVAVGVSLLAVTFTALAVLVGMLNDVYVRVLHGAGGVSYAMGPYRTVAFISASAAFTGGLGAALVGADVYWWIRLLLIALPSGLTAWALYGTVQLAGLTIFHGEMRAELIRGIRKAGEELRNLEEQRRTSGS